MPTVRYTTVNGEIIAEKRNGVRSTYVPDPLGSTVALLDNTQTITDTMSYWPYGEVQARTGTNPTPFLHVGTRGYRKDSDANTYVRARTLKPQQTCWLTEDPIGTFVGQNLYLYVQNRSIVWIDPSGFAPQNPCAMGDKSTSSGGTGKGQCPGPAAVKAAEQLLKNAACAAAFKRLCPGGMAGVIASVNKSTCGFFTKNNCIRGLGPMVCSTVEAGNTNPGVGAGTMDCFGICIGNALCNPKNHLPPQALGEALLWELTNFCLCRSMGRSMGASEAGPKYLAKQCSFKYMGPQGVHVA